MTSLPDRVFLTVLDSVGVGELPDADAYGDRGSDTLGNISRVVPLKLPTLRSLGLPRVANVHGMAQVDAPASGAYGRMAERSPGKDSVTGHWEMAGVILDRAFPTFPHGFPAEVIAEFERRIGRRTHRQHGRVGHRDHRRARRRAHADRTSDRLHVRRQRVSDRRARRDHPDPRAVSHLRDCLRDGGEGDGRRPGHRAAVRGRARRLHAHRQPPRLRAAAARHDAARRDDGGRARPVHAIGKIEDLFAGRGVTTAVHTKSDDEGVDEIEKAIDTERSGARLHESRRLRHASTGTGTTPPGTRPISSASTRAWPACCRACARAIS